MLLQHTLLNKYKYQEETMKNAMDLRHGNTYRKDNIPYLKLKADRHQSTSGKKARAAEMTAMGLNINQFGLPLAEGFACGGKIKKRKKRK